MRKPLIAFVLCIFAATAAAQCVVQAPVARVTRPAGPELIRTAAAGTRAGTALPEEDRVSVSSETAAAARAGEKPPRRAGGAMLLAALALMSGIALRRYLARMQ